MTHIRSVRFGSRADLPPRIHGARPPRFRQRCTMRKIIFWLLLAATIAPWLNALPAQAQMSHSTARDASPLRPPTSAAASPVTKNIATDFGDMQWSC
jgi:hypothetical protein